MSSFIYDPKLLEKLLVVAQDSRPSSSQTKLNGTALAVLKNLRGQLSPLKANRNPNFNDIETLDNFKRWAKENGASDQGNLLIENDRFNLPILEKFLIDLRDRFAANAEFSESLANLIDQSNKMLGTKIALYTPTKPTPEQAKPKVEDKSDKGPGAHMVGVKLGPDGLPTEDKSKQPTAVPTASTGAGGISLLDGMVVDFDEIYSDASRIYKLVISGTPKVAPLLSQIVAKIGNIKMSFDILTRKSPNLNSLTAAPSEGALAIRDRIKSTFNAGTASAYTYEELAKIAIAFSSLMEQITAFYYAIQRVPMFTSAPEVQKQMEWAESYKRNFMDASSQFMSMHQTTTMVR